jgi:Domain of unknown function (DUF4386)
MRKTSIATGLLFIVATIAVLAADVVRPALTGSDYLADVAASPNPVTAAALLYLVAAAASVGIAIALYPVLRKVGAALALSSVVFRTIEAVFYTAAVVGLLTVLTISEQLITSSASERAPLRAIADSILNMRDHFNLVAILAFCVGALSYYILFYRSRLVPRWLSGWGIAATGLMLVACMLAVFSDSPITGYSLFILPILLQELVLAVWLLAKGFSRSAVEAIESPTSPELESSAPRI